MSKELKLERKGIQLWYKHGMGGRVTMAVQYEPSTTMTEASLDYSPIYVGWDGEQGRPLDEVLRELDAYKLAFQEPRVLERVASLQGDIHAQMNMIQVANGRITELEKRSRGIIERLRGRKR